MGETADSADDGAGGRALVVWVRDLCREKCCSKIFIGTKTLSPRYCIKPNPCWVWRWL